ncbi:MAG TPA: class I SAM-dependent methyltransferase [Actinomycetota bacterium]
MSYTETYESDLLRGDEDPRPWSLHDEIASLLSPTATVLDVGCGTAFKMLRLARLCGYMVGLEPNIRMRRQATANVKATGFSHVAIVAGLDSMLPFRDEVFDVVTVMVAPHDTAEVRRVLKPGGYAIIEKIGERDKENIKSAFRADRDGLRGQFSDIGDGERAHHFWTEFRSQFAQVDVQEGRWKTYYSVEGLRLLLEQTPTVRGFNATADADTLREIITTYCTDRGIATVQHRILIRAQR